MSPHYLQIKCRTLTLSGRTENVIICCAQAPENIIPIHFYKTPYTVFDSIKQLSVFSLYCLVMTFEGLCA